MSVCPARRPSLLAFPDQLIPPCSRPLWQLYRRIIVRGALLVEAQKIGQAIERHRAAIFDIIPETHEAGAEVMGDKVQFVCDELEVPFEFGTAKEKVEAMPLAAQEVPHLPKVSDRKDRHRHAASTLDPRPQMPL